MEKGERLQYACGHWLVASEYGIQDGSVLDVPTKRCGECHRRLKDAAPQLLEALEDIRRIATTDPTNLPQKMLAGDIAARATAAIELTVGHCDPVQ